MIQEKKFKRVNGIGGQTNLEECPSVMNTGGGDVGSTQMDVAGPQQVQTLGVIGVEPKDETKGPFLQWREGI